MEFALEEYATGISSASSKKNKINTNCYYVVTMSCNRFALKIKNSYHLTSEFNDKPVFGQQ